jgi:hypothetical protein
VTTKPFAFKRTLSSTTSPRSNGRFTAQGGFETRPYMTRANGGVQGRF